MDGASRTAAGLVLSLGGVVLRSRALVRRLRVVRKRGRQGVDRNMRRLARTVEFWGQQPVNPVFAGVILLGCRGRLCLRDSQQRAGCNFVRFSLLDAEVTVCRTALYIRTCFYEVLYTIICVCMISIKIRG